MKARKKRRERVAVFPLKQVLAKYGWSQRLLAKTVEMDYNRVNDLCNARHLPNWETVVRIATALGADLGDFRPGPEQPKKRKPAKRKPRAKKTVGKLAGATSEG